MSNLLIAHGGAPTAVINSSLYGAVTEAKKHPEVEHIYGAIYGTAGILAEQFVDLRQVPEADLDLLLTTPASAIGTSRTHLEPEDYRKMAEVLKKHDIKYVLFNGGNGSMDTCGKLYAACEGQEIYVAGIPKTIDNDIAVIDHAPGYGSAARFVAQTVAEISQDVMAMPIHVCIIETMGRNAGWLTAAAALARTQSGMPPHLIYLPEVAFHEEQFLQDVKKLHEEHGGVVVVVSEGLKKPDGEPIVPPIFQVGRATYYGDVSAYLAELVIKRLGIKARSEKAGILGRCSIACQSPLDREEAVAMGELAAKAVLAKKTGVMSGLLRTSTAPYQCEQVYVPIEQVMLEERLLPAEFIAKSGSDVTEAFCDWCRPLVGDLSKYIDFKREDQ